MVREYTDKFLSATRSAATDDAAAPQTVLHAAFDAILRGDYEEFGKWVTDDVQLSIRGMGAMDGAWHGRDAVVAAARKNFGMLAEQKPQIEGMIAAGDRIAVLLRESGVYKASGETYSKRGVQWFCFAGGKIRSIEEFVADDPGA
jgi:ketosteroid isomerase-like protein